MRDKKSGVLMRLNRLGIKYSFQKDPAHSAHFIIRLPGKKHTAPDNNPSLGESSDLLCFGRSMHQAVGQALITIREKRRQARRARKVRQQIV